MKHSAFKRFLCLILAFVMIVPYCVVDIHASEETVTTISHTTTTGDINYFTFSETGWTAMGQSDEHVWSDDPDDDPSAIWYSVKFVGNKIDVYAGGNWPMGYVEYFIDGKSMGEYNLYLASNQNSRKVVTFDGLAEGLHEFKAVATGKNGAGGNNLIDCAKVVVYSSPAEEVTTDISHTQTSGDSNYFTFSETGWSAMGQSSEHVWSDDPTANPESVWYTVNFVGHKIDVYAGGNWPMGYVEYFIDGVSMGEFNLYLPSNQNSRKIATFDGLTESEHEFKAVAVGKNGSGGNDLIDCAKVVVYHSPYLAKTVTMADSAVTLAEGASHQLSYTVTPSYAELTDAVYTSSETAVATVSSTGLVTAVAPGTATVTLTSAASGLTAEVSVSVSSATPNMAGSIVDIDTQWTQDRYDEVKSMGTLSAELTAWKNDTATSELALVSVDSALKNVTVTASDFVSGENTIPASVVTATFIRSTKAYNGGYLGYGDPNRQLPADNGTNRSESSDILWTTEPSGVGYNAVQPVWVEIDVPEDAAAGTYTGTLTVTADGLEEDLTFTYTLTVQDVTLPDVSTFADTFDVELWQYPYSSAEYYGVEPFSEEHFEILESIMGLYKSVGGHAITTTIMEEAWSGQTYSENDIHYPSMIRWEMVNGTMTYDYTDFDAWVTFCKEMGIGDKIVLNSIAPWHNIIKYWENGVLMNEENVLGNIRPDSLWTHFLTDLIKHLEEKGWFDDAYIGIDERGFSAAAFNLIESIRGSNGQPLKTAGAMDHFVDKWDLALRVTDLNVGDTAAAANATKFAELLEARQAKGYRTTLYSCTEHSPGQFSLSAPVESYWVVLNAGMMDTAGFLRWAYDAWVADPLNDATHNAFEPGDCFLVYPDEKNAENPIVHSSVRLERIAEGARDVNKLMYIAKNAPTLEDEVDAVFANIQYNLTTSRSYLSDAAISTLRNETAGFKAGLNELTDTYIQLLENAATEVDSVTITDGESVKVILGETKQLTAQILPGNLLDNRVLWTSSDNSIVSVEDGLLTGEGQGTATVTATSAADPTKTDSIQVTVDIMSVDEAKQASYYSFDGVNGATVNDEWAEYDATMKDGATVAPGMSGNALNVTTAGVGAIVEGNRELSTDWTVTYWVKTTADFTNEISVLEDAEQKYSTSLKMANGRDSGFRVGDGSGDVLTMAYSFQKDTWYHIAWVRDYDQNLKLYVNGNLVSTNNWTANRNTVKSPIDVIGGTGFTGLIDEVKIYNAPLNEAEIAASMVVNGVNLNETALELYTGETFRIKTTVVSGNPDKSVTYVSADPKIATVDEKGLLTAMARGETTITVTNAATGYSAVLTVKVNKLVNIHNVLDRYVMPDQFMSTIERDPYDADVDTQNRQYLGQPDMLRTQTGRLITAYPVGHGKGPLVMQISDDDGLTWTEKTDIPASWAGSQETPTLYTLNVGGKEKLILITACPGWGTDSDGNTTGWNVSYSDDNGNTWTEYEHFWSNFSNGNVNKVIVAMASLVQLKDENGNYIEKWMGVYHNYDMVNYKTYLTFNDDGSMNWTEPVPYLSEYRSIESGHQICEVGMFRSPDGNRIVALARSQSHMNLSTMFWSDDEGETWSEPIDLPGSLAGERHKAQYDPKTGKLLITFREINYDLNGNGLIESGDWHCGDWGLWVGTYDQLMNLEDGEYCVTIDEDFAQNTYSGDTGYAGFVVLPDGTFVMDSYGHWDEDFSKNWGFGNVTTDLCYIRQARFKLTELEHELFGIHIEAEPVKDYHGDGSYDLVVKCSYCEEELSRETVAQFKVDVASMTMANSLDMNFAFDRNYVEDWTGYYAVIVKEYADDRPNVTQTVPYENWKLTDVDGDKVEDHYYVTFTGIAAKEMTDEIHVTIYNGEGEQISETYTDTVQAQAMRNLNNNAKAEQTDLVAKNNTMVVDMLNYGAEAQKALEYNEKNLANASLSDAQKAFGTESITLDRKEATKNGSFKYMANVKMVSNIKFMMAFSNIDSTMKAVVSYNKWNEPTKVTTITIPGESFVQNGSYYYFTIEETVIADGSQPINCKIYASDGTTIVAEVTDSIEWYTSRTTTDPELYKAIMKFSDSAKAYLRVKNEINN